MSRETNIPEDIQEQAACWLMRLDRANEDDAEQARFENWLAADSRHRRAYLSLEQAWRGADGLDAWRPRDGTLDVSVLRSRPRLAAGVAWRLAASVTLAVLLGAVAWFAIKPYGVSSYHTDVGGYQRVALPDGSLVQLNTDTQLNVKLEQSRREVRLLKGEAHFKVAHDSSRPFEVRAGDTLVRAVGTAFTVQVRGKDDVRVLVTEGAVSLSHVNESRDGDAQHTALLRPVSAGEAAQASPESIDIRPVAPQELTRLTAWQSGELVFDGMRLSEVIQEFNRYTLRHIEIDDSALANLQVGGNFRTTDVEGFLRALRVSFEIEAREADDAIHLSRLHPDAVVGAQGTPR